MIDEGPSLVSVLFLSIIPVVPTNVFASGICCGSSEYFLCGHLFIFLVLCLSFPLVSPALGVPTIKQWVLSSAGRWKQQPARTIFVAPVSQCPGRGIVAWTGASP